MSTYNYTLTLAVTELEALYDDFVVAGDAAMTYTETPSETELIINTTLTEGQSDTIVNGI
jgi:hypothetical protein